MSLVVAAAQRSATATLSVVSHWQKSGAATIRAISPLENRACYPFSDPGRVYSPQTAALRDNHPPNPAPDGAASANQRHFPNICPRWSSTSTSSFGGSSKEFLYFLHHTLDANDHPRVKWSWEGESLLTITILARYGSPKEIRRLYAPGQ